jgi:mannitol-1-phosphate/altronate dehydrogenase
MKRALIIGAGALGLGYLAERMAKDYAVCLADLAERAPLLRRIESERGCTLNVCGAGARERRRVEGDFSFAIMDGGPAIAAALASADLVLTAVGARALPSVVSAIRGILNGRSDKVWILFCENGLNVAASQRPAFAPHVTVVDTVMSRMCRFGEPAEDALVPLWPGHDVRLVVESYEYLPVDKELCQRGPFSPVFDLVESADFALWEHVKLFMHNGMHAYVSYHAHLEGAARFPQVSPRIRAEAERVMLEEVVPAILFHHRQARRETIHAYGRELLARFFDPCFDDSIERGVRGVREKLAPGERLVAGADFIRAAGIEPRGYASTVAAGHEILRREETRAR